MDLGGRFEGYTAASLAEQLRSEGLRIPSTNDEDLVISFALEHYANRPVPPPPIHRPEHRQARKSRIKSQVVPNRNSRTYVEDAPVRGPIDSYDYGDDDDYSHDDVQDDDDYQEYEEEYEERDVGRQMTMPTQMSYGSWQSEFDYDYYDTDFLYGADDIERLGSLAPVSKIEAEQYGKRFHPVDNEGDPYSVCGTSTARLCQPNSACCDILDEGNVSQFSKYGSGISLYFKFAKWGGWTFFILSLISSPQLLMNNAGTQNIEESSFFAFLFTASLGNLVDDSLILLGSTLNATGNSTDDEEIFVVPGNEAFPNSTLLIPGLSCDGEGCGIPLSTVTQLYGYSDALVAIVFMISVVYLRYFTFREAGIIGKRFRRIEHYTLQIKDLPPNCGETALKQYFIEALDFSINDVVIGKNNGKMIELYLQRGKIVSSMVKAVGITRNIQANIRDRAGNVRASMGHLNYQKSASKFRGEIKRIINQYDTAYARYTMVDERRRVLNPGSKSITAFVTFETRDQYEECLQLLKKPTLFGKSKAPKFQGKNLVAEPAPPPSTIKWEHLEYGVWNLRFRRAVTTFIFILSICVTFAVSYGAQSYRVELSSSSDSPIACEIESNSTILDDSDNFLPEATQDERDCFCSALGFTSATVAIVNSANKCHDYWIDVAPLFIFTTFATGLIALVNVVVGVIARGLAKFEKHDSVTYREYSVGKRLFIALSINVGLALLLVNAQIAVLDQTVIIGNGEYAEFTSEWYANVGTLLITTVGINVLAPHAVGIGSYLIRKLQIYFYNGRIQMELNELYLGPEFIPSYRYGQMLTTTMVSMLYGAGIPLFYPVATLSFFVYYWVDKYLFLHWYATPPDFGTRLAEFASYALLYAVPLHLGFAIWMYSAPGIFVIGTGSFFQRITLKHTIPLLLIFILSLFVIVLDSTLISFLRRIYACIGRVPEDAILDTDDNFFEDVTQAKQDRLFRVLDSYNILKNRRYMRSFGVTPDFANTHVGVDAVYREVIDDDLPQIPEEIRDLHFH